MASQAWLDSSLRRSARLGLEVLDRASKRSVDWSSTGSSQTCSSTDARTPAERTHNELDDAFAAIAELMAQTTCQCQSFYESGCCAEPSEAERTHVSRFHTHAAAGRTTPAQGREDFYIEVSPGTYAVTASLPASQRQTQLVSVKAGQSINLTFNL